MSRYNYQANELLVIGDDPDVEIKFAKEIQISAVLFDPKAKKKIIKDIPVITSLHEVKRFL